jgi:hypothetical protein
MRITLRLLGLTVFDLEVAEDVGAEDEEGGSVTATAIGFLPSSGDQRWQLGADYGAGEPEDR